MFINVHVITESVEDSIRPATTVEENDTQILSISVQGTMIQSCVQVNQKDSVQDQLSQGTEELVVEQEDHKLTDVEMLPQDGIVQSMKLHERETSEDIKESTQKEEVAVSNLALAFPHNKVEKAAPAYGPEEDAEQKEFFHLPELSSICADDLPDLEDVESTVAYTEDEEIY